MAPPLVVQVVVFLLTVLIGLLLGLFFDLYRVVRGRLRPGRVFTYLGDLLFWVLATVLTFALLVVGNWGELRLYVWVGFLAGAFVYHFLFSRFVIRFLTAAFTLVGRVVGLVAVRGARAARWPGVWGRRFWRKSPVAAALRRLWVWLRSPGADGPGKS